MDELEGYISSIRKEVLGRLDLSRELSDEELENIVFEELNRQVKGKMLSIKDRVRLKQQVFNSLRKLDAIQELVEDPSVTEIMVNGPHHIFYEKSGKIERFEGQFLSEERLVDILQQIVARHNRAINLSSPIVDSRLEDGSRVNMVLSPISIDGSALTIRKFPKKPLTMDELMQKGALDEQTAALLERLVKARYSMVISGGTGSGKTTFLNALSQYIPTDERIITIEDSAELQILDVPNLVRLETRNSNTEGVSAISIRDLIRSALRMRPDRIIVGECRGAEAFDMLQAFNTGHDGSLSTLHANSCEDVISRLEMMVLMGMDLPLGAIKKQIASGVDIVVQLGRLRDKSRKVLEIAEVDGMENGEIRLHSLYKFKETGMVEGKIVGHLQKVDDLKHTEKMQASGILE